jgi:hypothetical protein
MSIERNTDIAVTSTVGLTNTELRAAFDLYLETN